MPRRVEIWVLSSRDCWHVDMTSVKVSCLPRVKVTMLTRFILVIHGMSDYTERGARLTVSQST